MMATFDVILGGFIDIMVGNSIFSAMAKIPMTDGNDIKLIAKMMVDIWELSVIYVIELSNLLFFTKFFITSNTTVLQ